LKLIRVGDKVISWDKVSSAMSEILHRRSNGATQKEVALDLGIERTFISYLESIGSIKKGKRVALIGFPIANKEEVESLAEDCGVEFVRILSEDERNDFIMDKSSSDIFNDLLDMLVRLREYDTVIVIASDKRTATVEKILNQDVVSIPLGSSPVTEDKEVDLKDLEDVLRALAEDDGLEISEGSSKHKPWLFKKRSQHRGRASRSKS